MDPYLECPIGSEQLYEDCTGNFFIKQLFRKLTWNSGPKQRFIPLLRQYGHAGLDSTREENMDIMLSTNTRLSVFVRLESVCYVWYVGLQSFMTGRRSFKNVSFIFYFLFLTCQLLTSSILAPQSLPCLPPIQIMLQFTLCFSLPSNFWCSWVDGDTDWSSSLWIYEYVLSNFFLEPEAENLNPP